MKIRDEINSDMPSRNKVNLMGDKKLTINSGWSLSGETHISGRKWEFKVQGGKITYSETKPKNIFGVFEKPRVKISDIHYTYM